MDIKREYENIRNNNLLKYDDRKSKIYDENPTLKDMDLKIVDLELNIGIVKLSKSPTDNLEKELDEVKKQRLVYIKEHGIKDDYLQVSYNCEKCKDTGRINDQKCSCFVQKEIELFDNISHFKNYIKDDNFDNLDKSFYRQPDVKIGNIPYEKYMEQVVENIKLGIKYMDEKPYSVIFIGGTGTGKTFLSRCAGAEALKLNKSVLYVNVNEYLNTLKPDYDGEPLLQHAVSCDLFILDDLGTEKTSDFTNSAINYIVDKRLNDKKSTIITTNLQMGDIEERYLGPTYSRLDHLYIKCFLLGEDLRGVKDVNI